MVTLIGYLVGLDAALNTLGWALDFIGNHTLLARVFLMAWGNMFDGGYFWHYNELWIGGATAPGEKAWVVALLPRIARKSVVWGQSVSERVNLGGRRIIKKKKT